MSDLTGKVAIVTGGAQGVGGGISRKMALAGAVSYTHLTLPTTPYL